MSQSPSGAAAGAGTPPGPHGVRYRYTLADHGMLRNCQNCEADLDALGVEVELSIAGTNPTFSSSLDGQGYLEDNDEGLVTSGLHSRTLCPRCGENLADQEGVVETQELFPLPVQAPEAEPVAEPARTWTPRPMTQRQAALWTRDFQAVWDEGERDGLRRLQYLVGTSMRPATHCLNPSCGASLQSTPSVFVEAEYSERRGGCESFNTRLDADGYLMDELGHISAGRHLRTICMECGDALGEHGIEESYDEYVETVNEDPVAAALVEGAHAAEVQPEASRRVILDQAGNVVRTSADTYVIRFGEGEITCDAAGAVIDVDLSDEEEDEEEPSSPYRLITRFDVEEYVRYRGRMEDTDSLLIGWWLADGTYEPPEHEYRNDAVHPPDPSTHMNAYAWKEAFQALFEDYTGVRPQDHGIGVDATYRLRHFEFPRPGDAVLAAMERYRIADRRPVPVPPPEPPPAQPSQGDVNALIRRLFEMGLSPADIRVAVDELCAREGDTPEGSTRPLVPLFATRSAAHLLRSSWLRKEPYQGRSV